MHGNNKTDAELEQAIAAGVGYIVIDSFDEIDRLAKIMPADGPRTLVRVAPGIKPSTHAYIQTGQVDSKFGIPLEPGRAGDPEGTKLCRPALPPGQPVLRGRDLQGRGRGPGRV